MNELTVREPMTAKQMQQQVNLIQEVMNSVMIGPSKENPEGVHYGIIPGCKKPALYKAGAEKLSMTFRLRPLVDNDRDIRVEPFPDGHREVVVYCHIHNAEGLELATGIGSCSTLETKYRYRGGEKKSTGMAVPKEYWNLKKSGKVKEAQAKIGGPGFGVAKINGDWEVCEIGEKLENPDIADTYNTVLKMAKKRAYVDGILSATAASDIFTQDIEDMHDIKPEQPKSTSPDKPQTPSKPTTRAPEENKGGNKGTYASIADVKNMAYGDSFEAAPGIVTNVIHTKTQSDEPCCIFEVEDPNDKKETLKVWAKGDYQEAQIGSCILFANISKQEQNGKTFYIADNVDLI